MKASATAEGRFRALAALALSLVVAVVWTRRS
jgi:hypothetical protein